MSTVVSEEKKQKIYQTNDCVWMNNEEEEEEHESTKFVEWSDGWQSLLLLCSFFLSHAYFI